MNAFQFHLPTRILFGPDTIAQAGEAVKAAGGSRVLVLYGTGSVQRNGVLDQVLAALDGQKIPYCVEGGIQPNPRLAKAQELADAYADLLCSLLPRVPASVVLHRLTGDGDRRLLLSPLWSADKKRVLNTLKRRFLEKNVVQGSFFQKTY